jgi:hypothetical protein
LSVRTTFRRRRSARRALGVAAGAAVACASFVVVPTLPARAEVTTTSTAASSTTTAISIPTVTVPPGGTLDPIIGTPTTSSGGSGAVETGVTTTTRRRPPATTTTSTAPAPPPPAPSTTAGPTTTTDPDSLPVATVPQTPTTITRPPSSTPGRPPVSPPSTQASSPPTTGSTAQPMPTIPNVAPLAPPLGDPVMIVAAPLARPVTTAPRNESAGPTTTTERLDGARTLTAMPIANRDEAVDAATAPAGGRLGAQADVIAARSHGDAVFAAASPVAAASPTGGSLLISIDLPGGSDQLGVELRPSRIAAAWLVWLAVTFVVVAFWLPAPARRSGHQPSDKRRR